MRGLGQEHGMDRAGYQGSTSLCDYEDMENGNASLDMMNVALYSREIDIASESNFLCSSILPVSSCFLKRAPLTVNNRNIIV